MICVNELSRLDCRSNEILRPLTILLSPFAPHLAEEIWERLGNKKSIVNEPFPISNPSYLIEEVKNYPVSINGKMRITNLLSLNLKNEEIKNAFIKDKRTSEYLQGHEPKKWIIIPNHIINFVF